MKRALFVYVYMICMCVHVCAFVAQCVWSYVAVDGDDEAVEEALSSGEGCRHRVRIRPAQASVRLTLAHHPTRQTGGSWGGGGEGVMFTRNAM